MQAAHDSYADNPSSSTSNKNKSKQHEDMKGAQFLVQSNLKIMARSIAALSKISEDVYIEVSESGLFFKVVHRFKYCVFRFAPEFFNSCDLTMINKKAANICRLSMKSALRIFKGVTFGEKNFVGCEFRIDPKSEKMVVNLQMNYDINRTIHAKLREMSNCLQKSAYDRLLCRNKTVLFASTLIPILSQMKSDIEVTMKVDSEGLTIRNFHSGVTMFNASDLKSAKKVKTETTIQVDKLTRHEVAIPVEISFSLKEFLSIATFADQLGSEVCLYYDLPGKPMVLSIEAHANFDVELALATMGSDDEVDLDGGIIKETLQLEDTTKSSISQISEKKKQKKKKGSEELDITDSSSRQKRGPKQTQDTPSLARKPTQPSITKTISPTKTPLPMEEVIWQNNLTEREPVESPLANRMLDNDQEMQVDEEPERIVVPEVTIQAMQDVSINGDFMDAYSMVRAENVGHVGQDEVVDLTNEEEQREEERFNEESLFRVPEAKRKKIIDNRNKKMRRILMGTARTETMRMSQQFSGNPLVLDTQR